MSNFTPSMSKLTSRIHPLPRLSLIENTPLMGDEELQELQELSDETESVEAIAFEMKALAELFKEIKGGYRGKAIEVVQAGLNLQSGKTQTFEGKLTLFCMTLLSGSGEGILPIKGQSSTDHRRFFEVLATQWSKWISGGRSVPLLRAITCISMEKETRSNSNVRLCAKALQAFIQGKRDTAKNLFEEANRVGADIGAYNNPSICWIYATTFYLK